MSSFPGKRIRSGELRLIPKLNRDDRFVEIEGGPDIAVEIVSDLSVQKDIALLPASHHKAGTLEYLLVDASNVSSTPELTTTLPTHQNQCWSRSNVMPNESNETGDSD